VERFPAESPEAHFLQTAEWGELKSRFGWEPVRLITGQSGAQILFRRLPLGLTIAYIPKRTEAQIAPADGAAFWAEVDALCRRRRAILCKDEPDAWASAGQSSSQSGSLQGDNSTIPSRHNVQPRRTLIVDLRPPEEAILGRMKQKCRYNIRLAEKKGVTVRPWADTAAFHAMLVTTGRRDEFAVHAPAYYQRAYELFRPKGMCELLVAEFEGGHWRH